MVVPKPIRVSHSNYKESLLILGPPHSIYIPRISSTVVHVWFFRLCFGWNVAGPPFVIGYCGSRPWLPWLSGWISTAQPLNQHQLGRFEAGAFWLCWPWHLPSTGGPNRRWCQSGANPWWVMTGWLSNHGIATAILVATHGRFWTWLCWKCWISMD